MVDWWGAGWVGDWEGMVIHMFFQLLVLGYFDFGPREVECLCGLPSIFHPWVNGYGDC